MREHHHQCSGSMMCSSHIYNMSPCERTNWVSKTVQISGCQELWMEILPLTSFALPSILTNTLLGKQLQIWKSKYRWRSGSKIRGQHFAFLWLCWIKKCNVVGLVTVCIRHLNHILSILSNPKLISYLLVFHLLFAVVKLYLHSAVFIKSLSN